VKLQMLAILVTASLAIPGAARAKEKILFFDLEAPAASKKVAQRINASLRSWVASSDKLSGMYGKSLAETRQLYCKSAQLKKSLHSCLARVGKRMRADRLVIGSVLPDGADYRVVLTIIDTRSPRTPRTITERLVAASAQGPALEAWIRKWFNRLFKAAHGYLVVSCSVDGVTIKVGDRPAGKCGTGVTRVKAKAGTHMVAFGREGYFTFKQQVTVRGGETTRLKVALRPVSAQRRVAARLPPRDAKPAGVTPSPPRRRDGRKTWKALFFTTLSTGAVFLVASIFTWSKMQSLEGDKEDIVRRLAISHPGMLDSDDVCVDNQYSVELVDVCNKGHQMSQITNAFIGVGVGLVATSAVFLYFAYFAKAKVKAKARERAARTRSRPSFNVIPHLWERGGGVSATLRF